MLLNFFYALRAAKLPVSVKEYLTLLESLKAGLISPSIDAFYFLARMTLVKDEQYFDTPPSAPCSTPAPPPPKSSRPPAAA
ncbi:hypothetical protein ACWEBH_02685, partial [Micrococcus endophyticus]